MAERKVYQTSQGYFVVTPEKRRRDSSGHQRRHSRTAAPDDSSRPMLMSTEEALAYVHGEMQTIRDGDVTHQAVQTNLADVICGGNPNDKIMYARMTKRSSSFPVPGRLERRHSLRLFGSSKRLSSSLTRCGSMRHIGKKHLLGSDSSSSTEYPSTDCSNGQLPAKKTSLLSRLFRRSGRKQRGSSAPPAALATFSAQFPPVEWFNQRVVHLHSVGTQTLNSVASQRCVDGSLVPSQGSIPLWTDEDGASSRAATLPRRHRRHASGDSATCSIVTNASPSIVTNHASNITPRSSRRQRSSSQSSTLPRRSTSSNSKSDILSRSTSRNSILPQTLGHNPSPCKTSATTISSNEKPNQQSTPSKISSQVSVISPGISPNKSSVHQNSALSPAQSSNISKATPNTSPSRSLAGGPSSSLSSNKSLPGSSYLPTSSSKIPTSSGASPTVKSVNSNRNLANYPLRKNGAAGNSADMKSGNQVGPQKNASASSLSPVGNKSSITLQVSTTNRMSPPPSSSGYSSHCQSSNGRASVLSSACSSTVVPPFQRSVTVTAESPDDRSANTTTTTATINSSSNTKIYVQQQNSPVRSVITFENGVKNNANVLPNKDVVILNGFSSRADDKNHANGSVSTNIEKIKGNSEHSETKVERPKSLYSPREKMQQGRDSYSKSSGNKMERRKCPSLEAIDSTVDFSSVEGATKYKLTNNLNSNNNITDNVFRLPSSSSPPASKGGNISSTRHPNSQPPSTQPTCSDPTMNNARILRSLSASPALPARSKENLSYKNVLRNEPLDGMAPLNLNREGIKKNFCSNPSSPTKSFDNFGGSYGNLYIEGVGDSDKLAASHAPGLSAKEKVEEDGSVSKSREGGSMDLCPYSSLSDLTVHFKSIAAQKILKGVSINSIDTLVEVNMAAAEKQNNCDVTIHTDFGVV
ncbi:hypothetical protein L798_03274 [Zootermopsis nevadensis]|uniref:Uncharacterized protein n=2 Tax=Zootermopsis nevadensis TaxID=136037 RepID=A0A067QGQ0_ZOONE|nr:hypothetical protein L798_03274 [Zootermopsis nevadensis]